MLLKSTTNVAIATTSTAWLLTQRVQQLLLLLPILVAVPLVIVSALSASEPSDSDLLRLMLLLCGR
jgi:hypothetical protein